MKKSGFFAASFAAAASATAMSASSSSSNTTFTCNSNLQNSHEEGKEQKRSASTEKFAPRFDGLRFIETLVTAHR
ncbi:uncharacterized protein LOC126656771 [Mercurialis annua]|uniref:uncharacterized protein LOC126656771 n=1 Tax=Mercurialis annua TaxID=3986 RepID=UPI0021610306|nr:uncharacterized protein LOC126656771 [Mercurialis annua]